MSLSQDIKTGGLGQLSSASMKLSDPSKSAKMAMSGDFVVYAFFFAWLYCRPLPQMIPRF